MASLIEGLAGQQHGEWSLNRMLGQPGAFSVVYGANPTAGGDECALKLLKPERAIDVGVVDEFTREGELLIELQHCPNVVSIREANAAMLVEIIVNGVTTPLPVKYHSLEVADGCLDELVVSQHQPGYWTPGPSALSRCRRRDSSDAPQRSRSPRSEVLERAPICKQASW